MIVFSHSNKQWCLFADALFIQSEILIIIIRKSSETAVLLRWVKNIILVYSRTYTALLFRPLPGAIIGMKNASAIYVYSAIVMRFGKQDENWVELIMEN